MSDMTPETRDKYVELGLRAGTSLIEIAANAIAGIYKSEAELQAALVSATDRLFSFTRDGGEMDQRRDAAFNKLDEALERARTREAGDAAARTSREEDTDPGTPSAIAEKSET